MQHTTQNAKENKMIIEAELPVALEELALYVLPKKEEASKILELLDKTPSVANYVIRKITRRVLRQSKDEVKLKSLEHHYNDSQNMSHGVAYFKVELEGTKKSLKGIAGDDKLFLFDWQPHDHIPEATSQ